MPYYLIDLCYYPDALLDRVFDLKNSFDLFKYALFGV